MPSIIPGCVIWGVSDPNIFGYFYNKNILKNKSYLRNDQFGVWKNEIKDKPGMFKYIERNDEAFHDSETVFKEIKNFLGINREFL
jgi:hypothetical protein